jgi:hypothetical protein
MGKQMLKESLNDNDERRKDLFRAWLHSCPHGAFHSIENSWEDEATIGFHVDFAVIKNGAD